MRDDFLNHSRHHYTKYTLDEGMDDPLDQFEDWFKAASDDDGINEPNAMTLSTVGQDSQPSSRVVLLKRYDAHGFVFFTNYTSKKGRDMAHNPRVSLLFFWPPMERQIRINGTAQIVEDAVSDAYFSTRSRDSQLAAWASDQSTTVDDRHHLDEQMDRYRTIYPDTVPRPPHWGGVRVVPHRWEFWQGRAHRFHDRIVYDPGDGDDWIITRLCP